MRLCLSVGAVGKKSQIQTENGEEEMNENKEEIVTEEDLKKIDPRLLEKIKKGVRREVLEELAKRIEKRLSEEA